VVSLVINAAQLAMMQSFVLKAFDQTCSIVRMTLTDDGYGGRIETPVSVPMLPTGTAYNCNTDAPSSAMLAIYADVLGTVKAMKVRVQSGQDIRQGDRITIAGDTWVVQIVLQPESYSTSQNVLVSELKT
jgi:hypothetical protein